MVWLFQNALQLIKWDEQLNLAHRISRDFVRCIIEQNAFARDRKIVGQSDFIFKKKLIKLQ